MPIVLNEEQQRPAEHLEGAVLVTAGAGSGKTRLLTARIENLVAKGVSPRSILCITFTNKAAAEMKRRLDETVDTRNMWIMTFHAMCVRLLRYFGDSADGWTTDFTIYAEQEKDRVLRRILADKKLDADTYLKKIKYFLSDSKNDIWSSTEDYLNERAAYDEHADRYAEVMRAYQDELRRSNAMDFDDLMVNCYRMLTRHPDVLERVRNRFRYVNVDEFQDTNRLQYQIVKLIGERYVDAEGNQRGGNVFVVGDEDQSIYGWRGANVGNIFDFKKDFGAATYKLERNYRSTSTILDAANAIIAHNSTRLKKTLWTENGKGARIERYSARNETDEAEYVIRTIDSLVRYNDYRYSDMAVLMRLNALTRPFEERLLAYNIPYAVFGGFKFFDRKEVKDLLAYLRIFANPADDEAVYRVINVPKRGIGEGAVSQLRNYCALTGQSVSACCRAVADNAELPRTLLNKLAPFGALLNRLAVSAETKSISDLLAEIIEESGYRAQFLHEDTEENRTRLAYVDELLASVIEFEKLNPEAKLRDYLENVALISDLDSMKEENNAVTLATVHSAKGLEFKVVFVVGLDERIFPVRKDEESEMEEERRLMYVAVTRARERLYFTRADSRFLYGKRETMVPSRFLSEDGSEAAEALRALPKKTAPVFSSPLGGAPAGGFVQTKQSKVDYSAYRAGVKVRHPTFGVGTIVNVAASPAMVIVTVKFDGVGNKNLVLGLVKLDIVS